MMVVIPSGTVHVTDMLSTDAEIGCFNLQVLEHT